MKKHPPQFTLLSSTPQKGILHRFATAITACCFLFQTMLVNAAVQIDGSTNTEVDKAPNGVEIINIARPNNQGVSVNNYNQFDVDPSGLIINNSDKVGISHLGGSTYANPNFNTGDGASLILNQVTSDKISHLYGYTEIFGKNAALILANPNGIYAKGAGFINTNDISLITGRAILNNGRPDLYQITQGELLIEGAEGSNLGLDARGANYLRLISQIHKIRGDLHAGKNLEIQAGNGQYQYDKHLINSLQRTATGDLSIQAIGSMYAGNIRLIATEKGVGVKLDNTLIATEDNIHIDANGNLTYKNLLSEKNIYVNATSLTQTNQTYSKQGKIHLNTLGNLNITGDIYTPNELKLNAHTLNTKINHTIVADHVNIQTTSGTLYQSIISNSLNIQAQELQIQMQDLQAKKATLNITQLTNNSDWDIITLTLNAKQFTNQKQGTLNDLNGAWQLTIDDKLTNHGIIDSTISLTLNTQHIHNTGRLLSNQNLSLIGANLLNTGLIQSANNTYINSLASTNLGTIYTQGNSFFNGTNLYNNAHLETVGNLNNQAHTTNATSGTIIIRGNSTHHNSLNNQGTILLIGTSHFTGNNLLNTGYLNTQGNSQYDNTQGTLTNHGTWIAQDQQINANLLTNNGHLQSNHSQLTLNQLNNQGILFTQTLNATTTRLINSDGIQTSNTSTIYANQLENTQTGKILANTNLTLNGQELNNQGLLQTAQNLTLNHTNSSNSGTIYTQGNSNFNSTTLNNQSSGIILSNGTLNAPANITNHGTINAYDTAILSGTLNNHGNFGIKKQFTFTGQNLNNHRGAQLFSQTHFKTNNIQTINNYGTFLSLGQNTINTQQLNNLGEGSLQLTNATIQANTIDNQGNLTTTGQASIQANSLDNNGFIITNTALWNINDTITNSTTAKWLSRDNITIQTQNLINKGAIQTIGDIQATAVTTLNNSGKLYADNLTFGGTNLTNQGTLNLNKTLLLKHTQATIENTNSATLKAKNIRADNSIKRLNNYGKIIADSITLTSTFNQGNTGALIGENLALTGEWLQTGGSINVQNKLTLNANDLILTTANWFRDQGDISLNITDTFTNQTQQNGTNTLNINANTINNQANLAFNQLNLDASTIKNTSNTTIYGKQTLTLKSDSTNKNNLQGIIRSDKNLTLNLNHEFQQSTLELIGGTGTNNLTFNGNFNLTEDFNSRGNLTLNAHTINTNSHALAAQKNLSINTTSSLNNQANGYIYSGGNMDLNVNALNNYENAAIYSAGNLYIHKNNSRNSSIYNQAAAIKSAGTMTLRTNTLTNTYTGNFIRKTTQTKTVYYTAHPGYDNGQRNSPYATHKSESLWTERVNPYQKGNIISNSNMILDSNIVNNQFSIIRSNAHLTMANVNTISNTTQELQEQYWLKESKAALDGYYEWNGGWCGCEKKYHTRWISYHVVSIQIRGRNSKIGGSISASDGITGNSQNIKNGITPPSVNAVDARSGDFTANTLSIASVAKEQGSLDPISLLSSNGNNDGYTFSDHTAITGIQKKNTKTITKKHTIVDGKKPLTDETQREKSAQRLNAAYQLAANRNPDSLYLIESRTRFTDNEKFLASAYFFERIGFNPYEAGVTVFADAYTEQQILSETIAQLSHKPYLEDDINTMDEQMQRLYDNAIDVSEDLQLKVGIRLTAEQIAALKKDIIWYEYEHINGKNVLVPKIHLSQNTRDRIIIRDGAIMMADNIDLDISGDVNNSGYLVATNDLNLEVEGDIRNIDGNIESGNDLTLQAQNILNQSTTNSISWFTGARDKATQTGIRSGGNLNLIAQKRLDNIGSEIKSQGYALLKASTLTNRTTWSATEGSQYFKSSGIDAIASIQSRGDLHIQGNSFTDTAGNIQADQNLIANLTGNMQFNSLALEQRKFSNEGKWEVQRNRTDHTVSTLKTGKIMQIQTGGDLTFQGTDIDIGDKGTFIVGGNYTQQSVINTQSESRKKTETSGGSFLDGSETTDYTATNNKATHQASTINSANGITIQTAGNLNLLASAIHNTTGTLNLSAGKNLNLISGINQSNHSYSKSREGAFDYSNKGHRASNQRAANFTLNSGGKLKLNAKKDILLIGGNLSANQQAIIGQRTVLKDDKGAIKKDNLGRIQFAKNGPDNIKMQALELKNSNYSYNKSGLSGGLRELSEGLTTLVAGSGLIGEKLLEHTGPIITDQAEETHNSQTQAAVTSLKADNLIAMANNEILIQGSTLNINKNAYLKATDVNILAAKESQLSKTKKSQTSINGLGSKLDKDKATLRVAGVERTENSKTTINQKTTHKNANIQAGSLIIDADNDLTLQALNLEADDAQLLATNLTIKGVNNTQSTEEQQRTLTQKIEIGIKNAYVDTLQSANHVRQATQDVAKATEALEKAKKEIDAGKRDPDSIKDFTANLIAAEAQLANATLQAAKNGANAAGKTGSAGFYVSGSATNEEKNQYQRTQTQTYQGSNLNIKNNLTIRTAERTSLIGSAINAESLSIQTDELNILSGISHNSSESGSDSKSQTITASDQGITGGSLSFSKNRQRTEGTQHTLSNINATNINLTANTGLIQGANVIADNLTVDIDELTLASVQNTEQSQGSNQSQNAGLNESGAPNSLSISKGENSSNKTWTAQQTQLIGTNSARIKANTLHNKGGLIANALINNDGTLTDQGNLDWQVNTYTEENLKDTDKSNSNGINLSLSQSNFTLGANNNGTDKQGTTLATIGKTKQGTLIGGNNDLNNTQTIDRDWQTGGLDANINVDNRLLSKDGQKQIKNDFDIFAKGTGITPTLKKIGNLHSDDVFINGILNDDKDAKTAAQKMTGNKDPQIWHNPTYGLLYDVIESAVDYIGIGSANSKQADQWLSETENLKVHAHSQGTLILEQGAKNNPNRGHTYNTFGNPWRPFQNSKEDIKARFGGGEIEDPARNDGDYVSYPLNIFKPYTWGQPGHSDYFKNKKDKQQ
jgi:adhesin HecA-like repeat protein